MLELEIIIFVRKKLSALAMPQEVEFIDKLPKTSGKIMRRVLRAKKNGARKLVISTLENDM
jgi:acetyl-CoA synthetase